MHSNGNADQSWLSGVWSAMLCITKGVQSTALRAVTGSQVQMHNSSSRCTFGEVSAPDLPHSSYLLNTLDVFPRLSLSPARIFSPLPQLSLVDNLATGVYDFFVEPAKATT